MSTMAPNRWHRPTTHSDPVYTVDGVLHYCVANLPGAVGRTSTFALCNVTLPWALRIAGHGIVNAATRWQPIVRAINMYEGELTNRMVADAFGMPYAARFER
jgi:alanine dehydrogenase